MALGILPFPLHAGVFSRKIISLRPENRCILAYQSFSNLNQHFEEVAKQPALFEADGFNFIKLVQHALSYADSGFKNKLVKNHFRSSLFSHLLRHQLMSMLKKGTRNFKIDFRDILIYEFGRERYDEQDHAVSMYFHKWKALFGRDKVHILQRSNLKILPDFDFAVQELRSRFNNGSISQRGKKMLAALHKVAVQMEQSGKFSSIEMEYVTSSFHVFFEDFKLFDALFAHHPPKVMMMICHYHNEGLMAAARVNGVKLIELQHGLIARNDLYYAYPAFVKDFAAKSFFPDQLFLYGSYWKKVVMSGYEHEGGNLFIAGDYTYSKASPTGSIPDIQQKPNRIFVGAQKNMADYYVPYLQEMAGVVLQQNPDWEIWVKLHPNEAKPAAYDGLKSLKNIRLVGNETDLNSLLLQSKIQISIYSTTFYDAAGFGVMNFSLQQYSPSSDYAFDMVQEGIALPLGIKENPVSRYFSELPSHQFLERQYIYANFDAVAAKERIEKLMIRK